MKVKTNTLTGAALNYVVALAEGHTPARNEHRGHVWFTLEICSLHKPVVKIPNYAGGPAGDDIIDRERIGTEPLPHWNEPAWQAFIHSSSPYAYTVIGPTRRIAAMRCYVASKLGNEVDIPKELL